jgi:hypothetical protein
MGFTKMNRREFKFTKRKILLTSAVSIALLLMGIGLTQINHKTSGLPKIFHFDWRGGASGGTTQMNQIATLNYFFAQPIGGGKLCIRDSDSLQISLVLEQIIGTLVNAGLIRKSGHELIWIGGGVK